MTSLHRRRVWLECGCVRDAAGEGPLLLFYHRQDGFYGIRRMTNRINHAKDCDFHWEQRERRNPEGMPNYLMYHAPYVAPPHDARVIPFRKPQHQLGREGAASMRSLLFWLLNKAGLNRLDGTTVQADERMKKLTDVAKRVPLQGMDLMLGDILWTLPDAYLKRWAHASLYKLKERGKWPDELPMQGYLVLPVKAIQGNVLVSSGDRHIEVPGHIEMDGETACYPRMAMVAMRQVGSRIVAQQAYTVPVRYYGHTRKDNGEMRHYFDMMPVMSSRERAVGDELASITRWKHEKGPDGVGVEVRRPILQDDPAYGCSFVVEAGGAKVYVLLPENDSDVARIRLEHARKSWIERLEKHDRVFVLRNDEPVDKLKGQLLGWLKGEMKFD